jgi:hypothetical protein
LCVLQAIYIISFHQPKKERDKGRRAKIKKGALLESFQHNLEHRALLPYNIRK